MKQWIPYGERKLEFEIEDSRLLWRVSPKNLPGAEDEEAEVMRALLHPIGSPTLKELIGAPEGKTIAVVVDDNTRVTPAEKLLKPLLKLLEEYGVDSRQVKVIFALGSHRPMTEEEMIRKIGRECYDRVTTINHEYDNDEKLVRLGYTSQNTPVIVNRDFYESDVKICIGNIIPQFIAGWSGGAKIIQPGISGKDTTAQVHLNGSLDWPKRLGNPENNIRLDMEEIARIAGVDFIINTILNLDNEIRHVVAGDLVAAHRVGVTYAREIYESRISRQAEIVIAGTYPANKDMWQADKGLAAASLMVVPGGTVIWCPPCEEGVSPEHPVLLEMGDRRPEEVLALCNAGKVKDRVGASAHIMIGVMRRMSHIIVVSDGVTPEEMKQMGFDYARSIDEEIAMATEREGPQSSIGILTHGADIAPVVDDGEER